MRWLFWTAVLVGAAYSLAGWTGLRGPEIIAWKGAGVGLLAIWIAGHARTLDGWWIAAVLALGAFGDVLLDAVGLTVGGVVFFVGHLLAISFYHRHHIGVTSWWQIGFGALAGAALAYVFARDAGAALYTFGVCAMAIAAARSRFPQRVALGAGLFVLSDLLIFARMGPLSDSVLPWLLIWPLYFAGQALIAHGVVKTLEEERR